MSITRWIYTVPITLVLGTTSVIVSADSGFTLSTMPSKCVALRQGQICYQRVRLSFNAPERADYCLYRAGDTDPLQCWSNSAGGTLKYDFQSADNVAFYLHNGSSKVAVSEIKVAWVYKNKTRRRAAWRLF